MNGWFIRYFDVEGKPPTQLAGITIVIASVILAACIVVPSESIGLFFKVLLVIGLGLLTWDLNHQWLVAHLKGDQSNGEPGPTAEIRAVHPRSEAVQD